LPSVDAPGSTKAVPLRRYVGYGLAGLGAAGVVVGGVALGVGFAKRDVPTGASQADVENRNERIESANRVALVSFVAGGAATAGGLLLVLWPDAPVDFQVGASAYGARLHGAF
jgi:hypothetical protein